jgi:hypothetical protein
MFSALPPTPDITGCSRHFAFVPEATCHQVEANSSALDACDLPRSVLGNHGSAPAKPVVHAEAHDLVDVMEAIVDRK